MTNINVHLPYFDILLEELNQGNHEITQAFGRHVHWGYWDNPALADGSVKDFAKAAEDLCQRVCNAGKVKEGLGVLDVGCGFGGTIASLNERFSNMQLVGLNIDERQLIRARKEVQSLNGNQINFVQGDACQLPFEDSSFDVVLAVECIFHFSSREQFFQEVRRVLRPKGILALSDFVPLPITIIWYQLMLNKSSVYRTYGYVDSSYTLNKYRNLAKSTGFLRLQEENITVNTLPTYSVVKRLQGGTEVAKITALQERLSRLGLSRYMILSFVKMP
jgi:ubiquinone/menaquinone biosynthesis C-methylase UbiE